MRCKPSSRATSRRRVNGYSVGLSSGTSGSRGVFVVSPAEQAKWAGVLLAKLLPRGLFHGERVALFLRANNNLYSSVRNPWLSFEFFDLFDPFDAHFERLNRYDPTIVVGPAQVLRSLALARTAGHLTIKPHKVISGAEVLDPIDKALIGASLGTVGEVYQATEGFLAATCATRYAASERSAYPRRTSVARRRALCSGHHRFHARDAAHCALPAGRHSGAALDALSLP